MSTPVIDLRGVRHTYPDGHRALDGVDLHIHPGERVALLGPNGAGKTTLVLHLNGILRAGRGSVAISALPVRDDTLLEIRRRVGIVFQDLNLLPALTMAENVALPLELDGVKPAVAREQALAVLAEVGLEGMGDRFGEQVSGGQRQRAAIARALDPQGTLPLALCGGLAAPLRAWLPESLLQKVVPAQGDSAAGALRLVRQRLDGKPS